MFRKNSGVVLRVDLSAIGDDIKDASTAFNQLTLDTGCCSHCIRQTDGFGRVVSLDAVRDGNVHDASFIRGIGHAEVGQFPGRGQRRLAGAHLRGRID